MVRYGHPISAITLGALMVITAIAIKSYYAIRHISPEDDPLASWKVTGVLIVVGVTLLAAGIATLPLEH
jgi:hypothetical protein